MTRLSLFMPGAFAGLPDALRQIASAHLPDVELDFHEFVPSGMLARELLEGAEADIFVSANTGYMTDVVEAGRITEWETLAGNRLCIILRPDVASTVAGLLDLIQSDLVIVTPQSGTDPCGQYIVQMWEAAGLTSLIASLEATGRVIHSRGSGDLPGFIFDGRAEAGIFYSSEAKSLGIQVVTVAIPRELDASDRITFTIGAINRGKHPSATALAFVSMMISAPGQLLLEERGFIPISVLNRERGNVTAR